LIFITFFLRNPANRIEAIVRQLDCYLVVLTGRWD